MTIYEYGDRSKPHILLIHGMWMIHEMMLPYVDKLRDDYACYRNSFLVFSLY